jgi:hypothetical protein
MRIRRPSHRSFARSLFALSMAAIVVAACVGAIPAIADSTPSVTLGAPSAVTHTSAQLKGAVNPNGGPSSTNWHFEYSPTGEEGTFQWVGGGGELSGTEAEGTSPVPVEEALTGLEAGKTYYVRLVATNEFEQNRAVVSRSFSTESISPPSVSIDAPAAVTGTTAHFSGTINPEGTEPAFAVHWHFQCTPGCPGLEGDLAPGTSSQTVEADATGLLPGTAYQVSLVAKNAGEAVSAGPEAFVTNAIAPSIAGARVSATTSEAAVTALVNPGGETTSYYLEYGATESYGSTTQPKALAAGATPLGVEANIGSLPEGTSFHARLVAVNAHGTATSSDLEFKTRSREVSTGNCPNESVRAQQSSTYLPNCRAYELVTPADKSGGSVSADPYGGSPQNMVRSTSPDGNAVAYWAYAGFGDAQSTVENPYKATRGAQGWNSISVVGPLPAPPNLFLNRVLATGVTPDLSKYFLMTGQPFDPLDQRPESYIGSAFDIYEATPGSPPVWVSRPNGSVPGTQPIGSTFTSATPDGRHVYFSSGEALVSEAAGQNGLEVQYERFAGVTRMVGLDEAGNPIGSCGSSLGTNPTLGSMQGAVSENASRVYFSAPLPGLFGFGIPGCEERTQLYLHDGSKTVEVSRSQRSIPQAGEQPANFEGAALDGSIAYFTSAAALTNDAVPGEDRKLYAYDAADGTLTLVAGQVKGVTNVSADGSRVFFLRQGSGQSADLEVFTLRTRQTVLIGHLLGLANGDESLASETDSLVFGTSSQPLARSTADGSRLLFQARTSLTSYDSEGYNEVYLYDVGSGELTCVSCDPTGAAPVGGASLGGSSDSSNNPSSPLIRNLNTEGDRAFFNSRSPLLAADRNSASDVYEWHDGKISLISDGVDSTGSYLYAASADGRDVFFSTSGNVLPQDYDNGGVDIYDARSGGGFAEPAPGASGCSGESCQRSSSAARSATKIGSNLYAGPSTPRPAKKKKKKRRNHAHAHHGKHHHAHHGKHHPAKHSTRKAR